MAVVGDLFVNVRARTAGLNKGLERARRSLTRFARSGGAMIAGLAAGFTGFKLLQLLFSRLLYYSKEFGQAWARVSNAVNGVLEDLANELGPELAKGLNDLADWVENSDDVRNAFVGLAELFKQVLIPAAKEFFKFIDKASTIIAKAFPNALQGGAQDRMQGLGQDIENLAGGGDIGATVRRLFERKIAPAKLLGEYFFGEPTPAMGGTVRSGRGRLMAQADAAFAAGDTDAANELLRQIRNRLEVPR